jgi:hypothetical protein
MTTAVAGIFISFVITMIGETFPHGVGGIFPILGGLAVENPFPFAMVGSFAVLNGLFFYLMRAPTALGRPAMDQLDGLKLYLRLWGLITDERTAKALLGDA